MRLADTITERTAQGLRDAGLPSKSSTRLDRFWCRLLMVLSKALGVAVAVDQNAIGTC